ncbi:hypothetical protein MKX01_017565 [Papaver californicum]|nr:hypothetical protein MKX01_017565 [Papaver californicum]
MPVRRRGGKQLYIYLTVNYLLSTSFFSFTFLQIVGVVLFTIIEFCVTLSVTMPSVSTNALGYGHSWESMQPEISTIMNHFDVLGVVLCLSTAMGYSLLLFSLNLFIVFLLDNSW